MECVCLPLPPQMPVLIAATVASEKPTDAYLIKDIISECSHTYTHTHTHHTHTHTHAQPNTLLHRNVV